MTTITLIAPTGSSTVIGQSGTIYTVLNGEVAVNINDVTPLLNSGFYVPAMPGALNNYAGTTDPGVSNDNTQGYAVGSIWVNTSGSKVWICCASATGAATWVQQGAFGGTTVTAGGSGTAGTVTIYPTTASKGTLTVTTADNTGNTITNLNVAAQGGARTYTVPDMGGSASALMTRGTLGTSGITAQQVSILNGRNVDGTTLTTATTGTFGPSATIGTSEKLQGQAAQGNTKTSTAYYEFTLPPQYITAANVTVTAHSNYTGSGAAGTSTIQVLAYKVASDGTHGSNIGSGTTAAVTGSDAAYARTITGTTLSPGTKIWIAVQTVLQETGGAATLASVLTSLTIS